MFKNTLLNTLSYLFILLVSPIFASSGDYENRLRAAELAGDQTQVAAICKEWYQSGQYSPGVLNWNYNALMSVEKNALIFTQQESDTYPALLLQNALNVRPDVKVLGFQLLENSDYRKQLIQSKNLHWIAVEGSLLDFWNQFLSPRNQQFFQQLPIYFGVMTNKNMLVADKAKLYLTGLVLKYSVQPFDNVAVLRQNYEEHFRTDYLEFNLEPEKDPALIARLNLNYVPALVLLHRHYAATGALNKAAKVQALALHVARAAEREAEVSALFLPEKTKTPIVSAIPVKNLDKAMRVIAPRLYAAESEVTNGQYALFLQDLLKNKDFDQIAECRNSPVDWKALLPENLRNLPQEQVFKNGNPDDPESPVYNISHAAAQRYCTWITQVYNASAEKKKFKKVLFRLPTASEWESAAAGGRNDAVFPWGGPFSRNAKGCYLGNFKAIEPCGDCPDQGGESLDGGFFSVPAKSYFPNDFGLYCVVGNVAEMVQEFGICKGGSWQDPPLQAQIQTTNTYTQAQPHLGFRVFMEVIEE
ncbi:SUMF1/EgtB/PvdO family nonheme iron enzyme [Haliscomenobacter hydrossis]|uniref:Sulphatase-modifying factor protein n=1 Tax=Haliscomenobacter hydrossis (strain ATCC 27775 / DSM 1100 / LMG 10767 / O) TaxID=760192 RepID=F4KR03_HALH1|nr:SUMF1/EgtB/PvdO family nonheme iron enzyme [Haliscomenobacter hydrossis]AEE53241.1 Sulphatase-modifying factor protein [Haliscomenobacter hydrossis DSM 1100]